MCNLEWYKDATSECTKVDIESAKRESTAVNKNSHTCYLQIIDNGYYLLNLLVGFD